MKTVAIAGVGLIGGSFALALRQAGFDGVIGGVSSPRTIAEALENGIIDREMSLAEAAGEADLLFLAQPIHRIISIIPEIAPHLSGKTLVTDAGSTKAAICAAAAQHLPAGQFVGGHPMAGKESRGPVSADGALFRGRTWILTQSIDHPLESWVRKIGAYPVYLDPEEHDRTVAYTSHLPQLLSTMLAGVVDDHLAQEEQLKAAGPGLIDMTRLALSPFDIWDDILSTNREAVDGALREAILRLEALRARLGSETMRREFEKAAQFRRKLTPTVALR